MLCRQTYDLTLINYGNEEEKVLKLPSREKNLEPSNIFFTIMKVEMNIEEGISALVSVDTLMLKILSFVASTCAAEYEFTPVKE